MLRNNWPLSFMGRRDAAPPYVADDADYTNAKLMVALCGANNNIVDESPSLHGGPSFANDAAIQASGLGGITAGSCRFDGFIDRLIYADHADWDLTTDDFAFHFRALIDPANLSFPNCFFAQYFTSTDNRSYLFRFEGATNTLHFSGNDDGLIGNTLLVSASWTPTGNQVYYFLIEREGDVFRLWVGDPGGNTVCLDEQTHTGFSFFSANASFTIGASDDGLDDGLKGNIAEFEYFRGGTLRHNTTTFATPTTRTPRRAVPVATPVPSWANVKYQVHGQGADGSTTLSDESTAGRTITLVGNCQNDTGISVEGTPSILLDGTGDYFTVPDHADFDLGTGGDWCWEIWGRAAASKLQTLIGKRPSSSASAYSLYLNATTNTISWQTYNGGAGTLNLTGAAALSLSTVYHFAVTKQGSLVRVFTNGLLVAIGNVGTIQDNSQSLHIGRDPFNTGRDFNGSVNWVRFTRGEHVYDSDFTPPTPPLPTS